MTNQFIPLEIRHRPSAVLVPLSQTRLLLVPERVKQMFSTLSISQAPGIRTAGPALCSLSPVHLTATHSHTLLGFDAD